MLTSRKAHFVVLILTPMWLLLHNLQDWVFRVGPQPATYYFLFCVIVTSGSSELEKVGSIFLQVSLLLIIKNG